MSRIFRISYSQRIVISHLFYSVEDYPDITKLERELWRAELYFDHKFINFYKL